MFKELKATIFDDPEFKEDSVREEVVVPILARLGYSATGGHKIVRSKSLLHPFVMIGSKKHKINIIPDYLLYSEGRPGFVLDAKSPDKDLVNSIHAEQAYSYAIHPEVRVRFYVLCNGRSIVAYDIYEYEPLFNIDFEDIEKKWNIIASVLCPENVAFAPERHFAPDLGIAASKMGFQEGASWKFPYTCFALVSRVSSDLYTMSSTFMIASTDYLASFDIILNVFNQILDLVDEKTKAKLLGIQAGGYTLLDSQIYLSIESIIGSPTRGQHDVFVPFIIQEVHALEKSDFDTMLEIENIEEK